MIRMAFTASILLRGFCVLIVSLAVLLAAPDASAQCSATSDTSDSNVRFSGCSYAEAATANANRLDIIRARLLSSAVTDPMIAFLVGGSFLSCRKIRLYGSEWCVLSELKSV